MASKRLMEVCVLAGGTDALGSVQVRPDGSNLDWLSLTLSCSQYVFTRKSDLWTSRPLRFMHFGSGGFAFTHRMYDWKSSLRISGRSFRFEGFHSGDCLLGLCILQKALQARILDCQILGFTSLAVWASGSSVCSCWDQQLPTSAPDCWQV